MSVLKKKNKLEHKINHDRYLITYADLITLLLGLFVILYASATVDSAKYSEFTKAFGEYFKSTKEQVLNGGGGVLPGPKDGIPEPIIPNSAVNKSLQDLKIEAETSLKSFINDGKLKVAFNNNGVVLTLPESLLFQSGKDEIQNNAFNVLDNIAKILNVSNLQISVDGHTDSDPIKTFRFASNWHLSSSRALKIGYYLINKGMNESNVVIRGFGSQRPITENNNPENKAQNRRVEITISQLPNNAPSTEGYK